MKEPALPDVHGDWRLLQYIPIKNKNQPFEWMNHLTDEEIDRWTQRVKGNIMTAMIDTDILYNISKLDKSKT